MRIARKFRFLKQNSYKHHADSTENKSAINGHSQVFFLLYTQKILVQLVLWQNFCNGKDRHDKTLLIRHQHINSKTFYG